ncbi:MAG: alpha/beta hydrolase, partial [Pseudomonadota bacterium]
MPAPDPAPPEIKYLECDGGVTLGYRFSPGSGPTIVFLAGFKSDMEGTKAQALEAHCQQVGHSFLRFDYSGHGVSSGAFEDGTIGQWAEDARTLVDAVAPGPLVLVGSSMGGWIMLLLTQMLGHRVVGLVGLAAAPDFTERLLRANMSAGDQETLARDGKLSVPSPYGPEPT